MKLVIAIVQDDDSANLVSKLNKEGYRVTKLATTGGFLRAGNTTLMIGIEDKDLENVLDIIKTHSERRKQYLQASTHSYFNAGILPGGIEVNVGGSTVFVIEVTQMEKF